MARNNEYAAGGDPVSAVLRAENDETFNHELNALSEQDREVVQLMMDGERRTHIFAGVLGLLRLPDLDQRREVKRIKDRLKKQLQRARRRSDPDARP